MVLSDELDVTLTEKIARLVREHGWTQEEFAQRAELHRHTARHILTNAEQRLHGSTVLACARALELTVDELTHRPLPELLRRARGVLTPRRLVEIESVQPELLHWLEAHPDRAAALTAPELDELVSLQGTGGPLTADGVEQFIGQIERRRRLQQKIDAITGTEFVTLLEQVVDLIYDKICVPS